VEIDLVGHRLTARTPHTDAGFELVDGLSVAQFFRNLTEVLTRLGVNASVKPQPFGIPVTTPFVDDAEHVKHDGEAVGRLFAGPAWSSDVFEEFAGWYADKTSPVHLWHSFDLAVSRFSRRRAPALAGADPVTAEAYSHEVISFGFWAGDQQNPFPAYYSYTAPEPPTLRARPLRPAAARWIDQRGGSLALLDYDDVQTADDPAATLLEFLQSAMRLAPSGPAGTSRDGDGLVPGPLRAARAGAPSLQVGGSALCRGEVPNEHRHCFDCRTSPRSPSRGAERPALGRLLAGYRASSGRSAP